MSAHNEKSLGQIAFERFTRTGAEKWAQLTPMERVNWDASAYAVADALRYQHIRGGDKPIPEDEAIRAAHPVRSGDHRTYNEALRMVGAKRSKGALVELVNWALKGGRP